MTLKLSKTLLCSHMVPFLGQILTPDGIYAAENKIQGILDFPCPKRKQSLQEFLGTCVYLQRYHAYYANTVAPLYTLLEDKAVWCWTPELESAFQATKQLFTEIGILFHPDPDERYYIESDASSYGMGAVLFQLDNEGHKRLISCCSRTLKSHEKNYSVSEKELLSVIFALEKFRFYISYINL